MATAELIAGAIEAGVTVPDRSTISATCSGKRALVRVDLNVPMQDGEVSDDTRLRATLPTVTELADKGAIVLLLAHFGRPKGEREPGHVAGAGHPALSSRCSAGRCGSSTIAGRWRAGSVATLRPATSRSSRTPASTPARRRTTRRSPAAMAALGDFYVNDAFSAAHRAHASTEGARAPAPGLCRPGDGGGAEGARRRSAIPSGRSRRWSAAPRSRPSSTCCATSSRKVDHLIIGGGMANTFLAARGVDVGKSLVRARSGRHRARDPRRRGAGELHRPSAL